MNLVKAFQQRLGWKIFISYVIVIAVLIIVLISAAIFVAPSAFSRHVAAMEQVEVAPPEDGGGSVDLEADLLANFREAINESLALAALAALIAAVSVSAFVSRRIVAPIREMMLASRHVAEGHYKERVELPGGMEGTQPDELGQLALSFNQMADRLQHTEEMRRRLIGDVAHELRTPLTTIQGSMEGLIDGILPAEDHVFQNIHREATRLQNLVRDLQALSKAESGTLVFNPEPVAPLDLVRRACARLERQYEEKGVGLLNEVPQHLPQVMVDEDRVGQVLLNLLGNALQYTPNGGQVRISAKQHAGFVEFSVTDDGIGIAREHLPHLFTRFFRVDKSRSRVGGGSGVGLTIARQLVEASGGRIWVHSAGPGKGSTFSFTLPVAM
ncbi:MAG: HAMP domain-containing sensor histidine kinase [Anaerolineales bacterium]|nr:HAMP domain-containing sensor histidine kinase [Anaerolineales bacterium]